MNENRRLIALAVAALAITGVARAAIVERSAASVTPAVPVAGQGAVSAPASQTAPAVVITETTAAPSTPPTAPTQPRTAGSGAARPARPDAPQAPKREAAVGDTVRFGSFGGETLQWRIISIDARRVVLLAATALTSGPYQSDEFAQNPSDYGSSSVRKWLNESFVPSAFGEDAATDPALGRSSATDAVAGDIAYLLTARQVDRYLPEAEDRVAVSADEARTNAGYGGSTLAAGPVYWWLASEPGTQAANVVPVVQSNGGVTPYRYAAISTDGVRPAIKLHADAISLVPVSGKAGVFTVRRR